MKRFFLTLFSLSYFIVIYLVKEHIVLPSLDTWWVQLLVAIGLMICAFLLGYIGLLLCRYFERIDLDISKIESIEAANDNYLVNYIGFFLIATDMEDSVTLTLVFLFLLYLVFKSNVSYFNPAFLVFGYKFYIITTDLRTRIILITKQTVKKPEDILPFSGKEDKKEDGRKARHGVQVRKINEYVFIQCKDN
ncbi:hypothetical protein [uncultured Porphyromonas sp.]|uniref:hypothetical protein n=1 Tax=uncultured Porphyromonas sp. TaxID=159274 RepID=UPI00262E4EE8|nr:hypothetical protein [uncultured Porphyromonas sp.]